MQEDQKNSSNKKAILIQEITQKQVKINQELCSQFDSLSLDEKNLHFKFFQDNIEQHQKHQHLHDFITKFDSKQQKYFQQVLQEIQKYEVWKKNNPLENITIEYFDSLEEYQFLFLKEQRISNNINAQQINLQHQQQLKKQFAVENMKQQVDEPGEKNSNREDPQGSEFFQQDKKKVDNIPKQIQQQDSRKTTPLSQIKKLDVLVNPKEQQLLILSLFRMDQMQENQKMTKYTFPYSQQIPAQENQGSYIFLNYKFEQNEFKILKEGNTQVNSNIINAYANYLMIEDEKSYFRLSKKQRLQHKRLYIIRSELVTDCEIDFYQQQQNQQELFQKKNLAVWLQYLEDFKAIQYQFWLIYKRIGLIVNYESIHWYFIQLNFEDRQLIIYDSMKKERKQCIQKLSSVLNFVFSEITRENFQFDILYSDKFLQQTDSFSCGYYTCIAAEYLSQQPKGKMKSLYEIKSILQELLLPKENNVD